MRNERDFFARCQIARAARDHNVSILHLHSAHALVIVLWASLFNSALKLVRVIRVRVTVSIRKNRFSRYKYNSVRMTRHVAISEAIRQVMIEDDIATERITMITGGGYKKADFGETAVLYSLNYRDSRRPPDYWDRSGPDFGERIPPILQAAAEVLKTHDKVTFFALGDGSGRESPNRLTCF